MIPKIKQGNSVPVKFTVMENGEQKDMSGATGLSWEIRNADYGCRRTPELTVVGGSNPYTVVVNTTPASPLGIYFLSLSYVVDSEARSVDALVFELVAHSSACGCQDPNKAICLVADTCIGAPGVSAYEIYKKYHPESTLTEQEYADAPIDAAEKADQAADEATAAAKAATEAADKANEAAKSADDAAAGAIEATKDTIEATASANEAADKANTAAENADTAASSANDAAGNATEAADAANISASNADTAADKANTAAENADEQAGRAKDYADHPPKIVTVDDTNYWAFWDETKGDYVTSSVRSDGGPVFATFDIDPATMILSVNYQPGYGNGSEFQFSDGHLFYQIND